MSAPDTIRGVADAVFLGGFSALAVGILIVLSAGVAYWLRYARAEADRGGRALGYAMATISAMGLVFWLSIALRIAATLVEAA